MAASIEAAARRLALTPRPRPVDLDCVFMSRLDHLGKWLASIHIKWMEKTTAQQKQQQAAARALQEAQARRAAHIVRKRASESGGQEGPEPTRYGDWEKAGIVSDF
jgi:hypothetical protein